MKLYVVRYQNDASMEYYVVANSVSGAERAYIQAFPELDAMVVRKNITEIVLISAKVIS